MTLSTQFGTSIETGDDGATVGREAATAAFAEMDADRVDFCQVFASPRYDFEAVLSGVREVTGLDAVLVGCSSAGEFTDEGFSEGSVAVSLVASDNLNFFSGIGRGLSEDMDAAVRDAVWELPREVEGYPSMAAITLDDGLFGAGDDEPDEYKIRWPGAAPRTDGPLAFAVGIEEGQELRVMHSERPDQIDSVRDAVRGAREKANGTDVAGGFVYDCACRGIILGEEFDHAVDTIEAEMGAPFAGFESYGEVYMHMGEGSGYHNTTSVVMLLPS